MQGGGGRRCGASLTDDNAAYGDLDKQNVQIISEQCLTQTIPARGRGHAETPPITTLYYITIYA